MVLEVLDGVPLFDLLDEKHRLDWRRALHIARHVLSALAYAHGCGDRAPRRETRERHSGRARRRSGLSQKSSISGSRSSSTTPRVEAGNPGLTQLGVTMGTPTYIAPEQAFGQPIDARADLYSLSVMLFEMITGVPTLRCGRGGCPTDDARYGRGSPDL